VKKRRNSCKKIKPDRLLGGKGEKKKGGGEKALN